MKRKQRYTGRNWRALTNQKNEKIALHATMKHFHADTIDFGKHHDFKIFIYVFFAYGQLHRLKYHTQAIFSLTFANL